jgi:hypothetical protein
MKTTKKENDKQTDYDCAVSKLIMKIEDGTLKIEQPREGPFEIVCAHANGTVAMQKGSVAERLNMRQVIPCAI